MPYLLSFVVLFLAISVFFLGYELKNAISFLAYSLAQLAETLDAGACHECIQEAHNHGMHEDMEQN